MKKIASFISNNYIIIIIIGLLLLIPSIIGYEKTKVNYDILVYLPEKVDTIKGEKILTDDFGIGSYAFVMVDMKDNYRVLKLQEKIKGIEGVNKGFSVADVIGTTIPKEILPSKILDKLYDKDTSIIMVTFDESTSNDLTIKALRSLRKTVKDANSISSMTAMVVDTMDLSNKEIISYILIAVVLCIIVLTITTNSYIVPFLLLGNIGIAIIYNMGTNIFLGNISYITKAIAAVLQLGVTTDFSIFLYHKYEQAKKKTKNNKEAMTQAILDTHKSVVGSSLTTFVGFLALCTMDLTLGTDIGLVMAKGVVMGLICVLTIFPALLLIFDKLITKTKHKILLPSFNKLQSFTLNNYKIIIIIFLILLIPAYYGNKNYEVCYKLDDSLPSNLPFHVANKTLQEKFNITSPQIIIIDKKIKTNKVEELKNKITKIKGVDLVIAPATLNDTVKELLPTSFTEMLNNDKYQLILLNSKYEIASKELNAQIKDIEKLVHEYDKKGIVAGEGALMKDLVTIADHDFNMVNYTSIIVIFIVMVLVLQSIGLPIILIIAIEFGIFTNMAIAYYTNTPLPFVASIVVGTIQLGATIDYAILMSTTYLKERHDNKKEKNIAMKETLKLTIPSIITSALCFFAATIGVSLFTKIDMIGSITMLLARGAIISMLVVILVLPSLLLIFDKVILKTTKFKKEGI